MKKFFLLIAIAFCISGINAQVKRKAGKPQQDYMIVKDALPMAIAAKVDLFDQPNFTGQSKSLAPGQYLLSDFNDIASSIRIPKGMVAVVYEHGYAKGGYGNYVDLLEDCADLSQYSLTDKASYISIFNADRDASFTWARARMRDNQYVSGHWERKRAGGGGPDNAPPAVVGFLSDNNVPKPVDENLSVFRIEIRLITGKKENEDSDLEVFVQLNDADKNYFLDYGPDDFQLGADRKYDIISSAVRKLSDLKYLRIGVKGDDVWGLKGIELYLNNSSIPVYARAFPEALRLNGTGNWQREVYIGSDEIRNNSYWQKIPTNEAMTKPPVPVPFSMIKSMVESMVGNQMHQRPDNKLSWGNTSGVNTVWGDHVEGNRVDGNTLHFDLDLQYDITGPNPEIDVDFDLVFSCNGDGSVSIKTANVKTGCEVLGQVSCSTVINAINGALMWFGLDRFKLDGFNSNSNTFGAMFTLRSQGFKCKGVLVNPNGDVFIY